MAKYLDPELNEVVSVKNAEIERLRLETDKMYDAAFAAGAEVYQAEIERLKQENIKLAAEATSEIERLNELFKIQTDQHAAYNKACIAKWEQERELLSTEIERLREEQVRADWMIADLQKLNAEKVQDIKKYRDRLKLPTNIDHVDSISSNYGEDEIDRLEAEVIRQRELRYTTLKDEVAIRERNTAEIERLRKSLQEDYREWQQIADATKGVADMTVRNTAVERLHAIGEMLSDE